MKLTHSCEGKQVFKGDFLYNIDGKGRDDERFCLVFDNGKWNVYYSERGCKTTNKLFDTEDEALMYMLLELSD